MYEKNAARNTLWNFIDMNKDTGRDNTEQCYCDIENVTHGLRELFTLQNLFSLTAEGCWHQ